MQAEKPAVDGRDHQPPPCYGKAEKCGNLTACDRVGVKLTPERRARLEKGRGSISAAEIYNVLDRENKSAAKERTEK